jgi:hypothetical protein
MIEPLYSIELGYTIKAGAPDGSQTDYSQLEVLSFADLVYFHNIAYGDVDVDVYFDSIFPSGDASFDPPAHLIALALDVRWFWRYVNRTAFELRVEPGFYSSTEDLLDMPLSMPITAAGVYTADASLALVAGLQIRPGFNQLVLPYGGVVWQPDKQLRVEAMIPDARVTYYLDQEWSGYAGWSLLNTTYRVAPDWSARDRLTLHSQELYLGVTRTISDELHAYGSLGWAVDREAKMTRSRSDDERTTAIENALVMRVGVSGAF